MSGKAFSKDHSLSKLAHMYDAVNGSRNRSQTLSSLVLTFH